MNTLKIQDSLFHQIKLQLPADMGIADAISEVLHVSTDSAYRRIRGETPLVVEELAIICRHFGISIDQLLDNHSNKIVFKNTRIQKDSLTYTEYLSGLGAQLKSLEKFEKKEVIYMSKDLPVFYNFYFKPLIAFRYYFWMKIQLLHPDFQKQSFDMDILPPAIEEMSHRLVQSYSNIPSTEIWNMESINSTISQIEYSRTSGYFKDPADVGRIYDSLESTIKHIQEQADHGCKFMPGEDPGVHSENLRFFFNRVVLGDNTIMTITDGKKSVFINYGNLNYLSTSDENFCECLFQDFDNLKRRSTLISVTGERQRNVFFNILLSKIRERKLNAA